MKKKNILALALSGAIALTGAGYAYWTDAITINSTVSTGNFDVNFTKAEVTPLVQFATLKVEGAETNEQSWILNPAKDYLEATASYTPDAVTFAFDNVYPGTKAMLKMTAENDGTIPALFDYAQVDASNLNIRLQNAPLKVNVVVNGNEVHHGAVTINGNDGKATLEQKLNEVLAGMRLEPNESMNLNLNFILPGDDVDNADSVEGLSNQKLVVKLNWTQHNAAPVINGGNQAPEDLGDDEDGGEGGHEGGGEGDA